MKQFLDALRHVMTNGTDSDDRTGTGTYSVFGYQSRYNLDEGFPLSTTGKVPLRWILEELFWMRDGETNNELLMAKGVDIWKEWALPEEQTREATAPKSRVRLMTELGRAKGVSAVRANAMIGEKLNILESQGLGEEAFHEWLRGEGVEPFILTTHPKGDLGPIYGAQWRNFAGVDQLRDLIRDLRLRPFSRRHVVSAWNPAVLPDETATHQDNILNGRAVLASCHAFFQCHCRKLNLHRRAEIADRYRLSVDVDDFIKVGADGDDEERFDGSFEKLENILDAAGVPKIGLSLQMYQRSCDICCGARFNIAFYSALTMMLGRELNYHPEEFIHDIGNLHIYKNHIANAREHLKRTPKPLPKLRIAVPAGTSIFNMKYEDFKLEGYDPMPKIDYPVSI